MNRRQKIIVSVTGIFLVLLLLVGLTYAYFLTQISGNTNDKSISVTTANLALVYGDGNGLIEPTDKLLPGTTVDSKTFTVKNEGNAETDYVVVIENVSVTNATTGETTSFESNDFVYTLTCTSDGEACDGTSETSFPITGGILVGNSIEVGKTHTYSLIVTYKETGVDQSTDMNKTLSARVNIKDIAEINPYSDDTESLAYSIINNAMLSKNGTELVATPRSKVAEEISYTKGTGKMVEQELDLSGKEWYYGSTYGDAQPWNGGSMEGFVSTCSDTIVNKYISYPTVGKSWYVKSCKSETIAVVEAEGMEYESSIQTAQDDLGTSYYYRGNVEDNYVNFAGMCWRIVRIAGDGSTKLILEDQYTTCDDIEDTDGEGTTDYAYTGNWNIGTGNYGYELKNVDSDSSNEYIMNYLNPVASNTSSMVKAFYDFQTTKLADYTGKLKSGDWCLADKAYTQSGSSPNYTYTPLEEYDYSGDMDYDAYTRLTSGNANGYQPTLKCNGTILNEFADVSGVSSKAPMYVSALTVDEIVYAGGKYGEGNSNYYLINKYRNDFWSLSPDLFNTFGDFAFVVVGDGFCWSNAVDGSSDIGSSAFRPSVSLASSAVISEGEGTLEKPYKIG